MLRIGKEATKKAGQFVADLPSGTPSGASWGTHARLALLVLVFMVRAMERLSSWCQFHSSA